MKVLFIGDIYGDEGLDALLNHLPTLKDTYKPNIIIANAENAANGKGLKLPQYKKLMSAGVHALTMGNWTFGHQKIKDFIDDSNIIRPINLIDAPGYGHRTIKYNNQTILIINALGKTYMNPHVDNPFSMCKEVLLNSKADYKIIDFHAEATSEKVAFAYFVDGLCDAVVGTHTHIQTADEKVLPNKTLYITDVGMTGPKDGVIGVDKQTAIQRFLTGYAEHAKTETGDMQISGVFLDLDKKHIQRIYLISKNTQ